MKNTSKAFIFLLGFHFGVN